MQEFLRWLASLRGIEVEPGAELRFELSSFPAGGLALLILLGTLIAIAGVYFIYRRDGKLRRWQRLTLATLRVLAILAAIMVVLEPNLVAVKKERRDGHAIILLDLSQSMGHRDPYRENEPKVQRLLESWEKLGVKDPRGASRLELAKALLAHEDNAIIKKLNERNRVMLWGFASGVEPLPLLILEPKKDAQPPAADTQKRPAPVLDLANIKASGRYSNLGGAVRAAVERSRGASIAAVVVISDGRRNVGAQGSEVARFLTQRKVDHSFLVGVGDPSEAKTVTVTRIEAPEKAFQKDPFKIRASLASEGYDKQTLTVKLLQVPESGGAGTVVESKQVSLGGDSPKVDVDFENLKSEKAGVFTYKVAVVPPGDEPESQERHAKQARVEVLDEQTRVLLIAGSPLHEYQILRNLLTRDKTIELSCWLSSADKDFPQDGNVALKTLPLDRKELEPFDVVVLMDPDPQKLERSFCEMLADQVKDAGTGLWWICGEKYTLDALRDGASTYPLAELLPVNPDLEKAETYAGGMGIIYSQEWPYMLTPEGEGAKAIRLLDAGADEAAQLWTQLPGWHFAFPVRGPKPAAQVWLETDHEKLRSSRGNMPLLAAQTVGAGRVMFSASDETYRWRSLYEGEYNRYWVKSIRYLFEGRLTAGSSRLRILLGADKVELGDSVKIVVDAKDETYQPLLKDYYEMQIARGKEPPQTIRLVPVDGVTGQFEYLFQATKTGFFRVAPVEKQRTPVEGTFQVIAAAVEKEGPVNTEELSAIAETKGGELIHDPDVLLEKVGKVPSRTTVETFKTPHAIWDSWVTVAIILFLLTIEWWLRKRFNLL